MSALIGSVGLTGFLVCIIAVIVCAIKKSKNTKKWAIGIGVCFALFVVGVATTDTPSASVAEKSNTEVKVENVTPNKAVEKKEVVKEVLPITDLDFFEVRKNLESMTEAQWKNYIMDVEGKRIHWTGYVDEVEDNGEIWIDMDAPDELSVQDMYISVPKEDALKYNKDAKIEFEGTIRDVGSILGSMSIQFKDIVVISVSQ